MNSSIIYLIVLIVMNMIEYSLLNVFLSHYFEKRCKYFKMFLVGLSFVGILTSVNVQRDLIKNISIGFILMLITASINYQGRISKKFAFTVIFITMSAMAEVILTFIASIVAVIPLGTIVESVSTYIISGLGGKIILLLIVWYLVKKYPQYYEMDRDRDIIMLSLFPMAALITAYVILEFDKILGISHFLHIITIGLLVMFLCLSVSIFFIYHSALHKKQLENELLLNEEIKLIGEKVFNQQIETVNKISAIQHEYKRHLKNVIHYIEEQKYEDLDKYVNVAMQDADKYLIPIPVNFNNFALNSLYGRFVLQCAEYGITLSSDIRYRKFDFLSEFDASVIFGNLFDNSLEACTSESTEKRRVDITIISNNNLVVITLSNSYAHKIVMSQESGLPLSTRRNYLSVGHGIKNVQSTLQNYNGYLSYTHAEGEFTSIVRINTQKLNL